MSAGLMGPRSKLEHTCEQPGLWMIEGRQVRRVTVTEPVNAWGTRRRRVTRWRIVMAGRHIADVKTLQEAFELIAGEVAR